MHQVKILEFTFFELFKGNRVHVLDMTSGQENGHAIGNVLAEHFLLKLVVEEFSFHFGAFLVGELAATERVSDCDDCGPKDVEATSKHNIHPRPTHDLVEKSWVRVELEVAFFGDRREARKVRVVGYSHVRELEVAIVDAIVAQLGANVANFDPREWLVSVHVSDLNYERLDAIVILATDTAGKDDGMV